MAIATKSEKPKFYLNQMSDPIIKPLISVIIPTYNRADLIPRAIASATEQTYQNLEIIVVDDASGDSTTEVVKNIADSRLRYIRHEANLGGSTARNTGIDLAQGEYIAFLDSDDLWLNNKIEQQLAAILNSAESENIVSYTQFQLSNRSLYRPSIFPSRGIKASEAVAEYLWLAQGEMLTSTLMLSRQLAVKVRFNAELNKHQDLDFVLRLAELGAKFIFVPRVLTIWHNEARSDRISQSPNYRSSLEWIQNYRQRVSQKAYKGFLLKEIVPQLLLDESQKPYAARLILNAFREKVISVSYLLFLMAKLVISTKYKQYLKIILRKAKLTS